MNGVEATGNGRGGRARRALTLAATCALALAIGGAGSGIRSVPADAAPPGQWGEWVSLKGVVDVAGPRRDGTYVAAADGLLWLVSRGRSVAPFGQDPGGYRTKPGTEPYIAVAHGAGASAQGCAFAEDDVFALEPGTSPPSVIRVDGTTGKASTFASAPPGMDSLGGLAFDGVGNFNGTLLVVGRRGAHSEVLSVDCRGNVGVITDQAPPVEGGMAVAPPEFGDFHGDLVAADENSGTIFAIDSHGVVSTLATPSQPSGPDIGVESAGFVPRGGNSAGRGAMLVADRGTPGSPHPGTDTILEASIPPGVSEGDLLVVSEASARTVAVHCAAAGCTVSDAAIGPAASHVEGHLAFVPLGTAQPLGVTLRSLPGESGAPAYLFVLALVGLFLVTLFASAASRPPARRR